MKRLANGAALGALACAISTGVYAQETTASLRGQLTGSDGQPVADAQVTILHTPSGTRQTTSTNGEGVFDARGLRVGGPYTVSFSAPGFDAKSVNDVVLGLGETLRLDVDLAEEGLIDELVVTAARDPEADNTSMKTTLDTQSIESVVSVTRDIRDLARRSPLVTQNTRGDGGISIAGSNPRSNRITIDGAQAQDDFGLNTGGTPTRRGPISLDAVEQFTVDAVPTDVENGDFAGGALDVVLKSGTNQFHGAAFLNYLNDGMVGRSIRGADVPSQISQENWGGFLSGPIWKDRLFFAGSYELYKSTDLTATGPEGAGFANSVRGVNQARIDQVVGLFNTNYASDFEAGGIPRTKPVKDEKYSFKIDANLTDRHRASFTARYALSELYQRTNISTSSAGLDSQWYLTGEEDYSYVVELNSNWTDNFSTQLRVTMRDYERRQLPPSGQEFSDIQICNTAVSDAVLTTCTEPGQSNPSLIRFGPDEFRHANALTTDNGIVHFKAEWALGDHLLKFGAQAQKQEIFNIFIPTQDGQFFFDSIADFAAGRANRLRYTDAIGGRTTSEAAARLEYQVYTLFAQDTLDITPDLQVTAGFRFDWYKNDDPPPLNVNFLARNGFSNTQTYDGKSVMMPRFRLDWRPMDKLKLAAGFGLFSGGVPDVFASNPYGGGAGFLTSGIDISRCATPGVGTCLRLNAGDTLGYQETTGAPGFTAAIGSAALNINQSDPNAFYALPASVIAFLGSSSASPATEVAAFSPGFKFPSDWKLFLSAQYDVWDGWRLGLDIIGTKVQDGLYARDIRANQLVVAGVPQFLPDGRIRYDGIAANATRTAANISSTNAGTNRDLVFFNSDKGKGFVAALSLSKSFDFGLDFTASYTYQDIKDYASSLRFSSTQSSSYQAPSGLDPNLPEYGTSYDEIEHSFKFDASYGRKFFGDNETRITVFAERRSGRATSFTMGDATTGRGPVFGVNRGNNHLLYVPDMTGCSGAQLNCGLVTFADAATRDNFAILVSQFGLPQGQIVPKGFYQNDDINLVDLQFSQEFPSLMKGHKFKLVVDVQNVLNLLNDKWGIVEEYFDVNNTVQVNCADANGVAAAAGSPVCARYRYQNFQATSLRENIDTAGKSLWTIQVGLRYQF